MIGTCLLSAVVLISPVILENPDRDDGPRKRTDKNGILDVDAFAAKRR